MCSFASHTSRQGSRHNYCGRGCAVALSNLAHNMAMNKGVKLRRKELDHPHPYVSNTDVVFECRWAVNLFNLRFVTTSRQIYVDISY